MKRLLLFFSFVMLWGFGHSQDALDSLIESEKRGYEQMHNAKALRSGAVQNEDVTYEKLELQADPKYNYIKGKVTTYYIPYTTASSVEFDLSDTLTVDSIWYHNAWVPFTRPGGDVIHIELPLSIRAGVIDSIAIYYEGAPAGSGFGSFVQSYHDSVPVIWTLSEPYGAKDWWPCKQNLSDKIDSLDVIVTCPDTFRAASNGLLVEEIQSGNNKIYHWKHRYPIAAYLVCFAVTNYAVYYEYVPFGGDTLPMLNYVYPEHLGDAHYGTHNLIACLQLYDSLFGEYAFQKEKYGHAEFGWGGGMEHQTMTFVTAWGFELLAHELAHHWFGDKVTCNSWGDIWLNEGFATYLSGLCYEYIAPRWWMNFKTGRRGSATRETYGSVYCDDTTSVPRIFSGDWSYNKGAMVLHMLRWIMGDSCFFKGLRDYLHDPQLAYSFAKTADLKAHLEAVSGKDLNKFFNDWIYGQGWPAYDISWTQEFDGKAIFYVKETPSDASVSFFELPLPVRFKNAVRDTIVVLNNTFSGQKFTVPLPFMADSLIFDPDVWLISKNNTVTRTPAYDFSFFIYPNPVSNILQLRIEASSDRNADIRIYNSLGQLVSSSSTTVVTGPNMVQVDASRLQAGVYRVKVKSQGQTQVASFVKGNR